MSTGAADSGGTGGDADLVLRQVGEGSRFVGPSTAVTMIAAVDAFAPFTLLREAQDRLIAMLDAGCRDGIWRATETLCSEILALERIGMPRQAVVEVLAPVRAVHAESPFVRRLQTWPRGYPGDFETIEYLVGGTNLATRGTRGWWAEQIALTSPIAVQHRCKVRRQAEEIRRACTEKAGARVLILACGGGRDLQVLLDEAVTLPGAHITLVDQDPDAVALATDRAQLLGATVTPLCVDVLRGLRRAEGPFDLVLAGGLFDYLEDSTIVLLMKLAKRKMAEGGVFFFTNIAEGNPYRAWIEYVGDWSLIERSAAPILGWTRYVPCVDAIHVALDATSLSYLCTLRS